MGDAVGDFGGDALSFVAHDDDACRGEWGAVDVVAIEECAVDGDAGINGEVFGKRGVDDFDTGDGTHGSLDDFGVEGIDGVVAGYDGADAKPVGDAYDGAEVAGILNAVESEDEVVGGRGGVGKGVDRKVVEGNDLRGGGKVGHALHVGSGDLDGGGGGCDDVGVGFDPSSGGKEVARGEVLPCVDDAFCAFGNKALLASAGFGVGERCNHFA